MDESDSLPLMGDENRLRPLGAEESFRFSCHSGVSCFTECCRELELALSPYDVVRLRQNLALSSKNFLEQYAIIEFSLDDDYPKVYLAMIDDGRASCPFVSAAGCGVYTDRPAACRTYPIGRGASLDQNGEAREQFVIITEDHCRGFAEEHSQTVNEWQNDQQAKDFNRSNDRLLPLLTHDLDQPFPRLSDEKARLYIDTLYRLDQFKIPLTLNGPDQEAVPADEQAVLINAINWLQQQWQTAR